MTGDGHHAATAGASQAEDGRDSDPDAERLRVVRDLLIEMRAAEAERPSPTRRICNALAGIAARHGAARMRAATE